MGTKVIETEVDRTPPEQPRKRPGRWSQPGFRRAVIGAAALVLVGVAGAWYYYTGRVTTDDAQVDGHITPIASQVYGNVLDVLVHDNEHVKAGQVLLRIDPRDYQAKVAQAEAALALAEAQAEAARVGVRVCNCGAANSTPVAEHAILLMLAVAWFWHDSLGAREAANAAAFETCHSTGATLLDGTVACRRLETVRVARGTPLQEVLFAQGVEFPCGGRGLCKGCKIKVLSGSLTSATGLPVSWANSHESMPELVGA